MCNRLLVLVLACQKHGEIVMCVYSVGFETQSLFKLLDSALHVTNLRERSTEINVRRHAVRLCYDSFAKLAYRVRIPARLECDLSAREIYTLARYQITQTIHERIRHAHANRSLLRQMRLRFLSVSET